ncbi:MAG TPA: tetratricopeptide repeat protein [Candidatus Udaeobacter sp.]|nr:tetratricopeptide repeat protein [Candidatus Udaeobacter sp.]
MNRKERRSAAAQGRRGIGEPPTDMPTRSSHGTAEQFAAALRHHQLGRLSEAERLYRQILAVDPGHAQSMHLLGVIAHQSGRNDVAVDLIEKAISLNGRVPDFHSNLGGILKDQGRLTEAVACYRRALALKPDFAEVHNNLGTALKDQGKLAEAATCYERTLALKPDYAQAHNNLGRVRREQGKLAEAVACHERALALKPDFTEAYGNLGNALQEQGKLAEAVACYERALALNPKLAEAHDNLGNALREQGKLAEAMACHVRALELKPSLAAAQNNLGNAFKEQGKLTEATACYERALAIKPDFAEAHNNLGNALKEQGRLDQAAACYERALALKPSLAAGHNNLGGVFKEQGRLVEAVACYERALALKPGFAEAHSNLGGALQQQGKLAEAMACYERALALKPDFAEARFALCMAPLPIVYGDEAEIESRRATYQENLQALSDHADRQGTLRGLARGVGTSQPFYLAYQGYNDRECQIRYGSLICRIMADCYAPAVLPGPPEPQEPVRVGIVSGFFRQHSNWKVPIKGWLARLDRRKFRIFGYHTGIKTDGETRVAAAMCDRFVQGPLSGDRWRQEILRDAPHVLIYPEIGMDPVSARLAAQRLAPLQCNSWGHPETSGYPTLDCFLSSALMEPPDGQEHYSERLVRLPNLSIYYEPLDVQGNAIGRSELGLRPAAPVYWCGQSLYKYLPQFDQIFPRIAREVGDCQFAFIEYSGNEHVNNVFQGRLARAFAAFGLNAAEHCVVLPELDQNRFVAAIGKSDIVLDSIGWSGCNSTLETLAHDLPIVTMAGPLMRGRHSMAILQMMGVTETIAETIDGYVATAVRLAQDTAWRKTIGSKISENKHKIYRDRACISALEEFLDREARLLGRA